MLAAGGIGERIGGSIPKQFIEVAGRSLLRWSFDAVYAAGIHHIVVVVPPDHIDDVPRLLPGHALVVPGGASRQASVRNGLGHVEGDAVVVHDAARPFAPPALFAAVVAGLEHSEGVVPGLQMRETVKIVRDARVVRTLDREQVWSIQTPQAFRTETLRDVHRRAERDGVQATDDAQLVEHYGGAVSVVEGSPLAFKVTDGDDIRRAEQHAREVST